MLSHHLLCVFLLVRISITFLSCSSHDSHLVPSPSSSCFFRSSCLLPLPFFPSLHLLALLSSSCFFYFKIEIKICLGVKLQSKEPPKCVDTTLDYTFVWLKYHKTSIIVWIVIIFFGIFFINRKVYMLKV